MSALLQRERVSLRGNRNKVKEETVLYSEDSWLGCLYLSKGEQRA